MQQQSKSKYAWKDQDEKLDVCERITKRAPHHQSMPSLPQIIKPVKRNNLSSNQIDTLVEQVKKQNEELSVHIQNIQQEKTKSKTSSPETVTDHHGKLTANDKLLLNISRDSESTIQEAS